MAYLSHYHWLVCVGNGDYMKAIIVTVCAMTNIASAFIGVCMPVIFVLFIAKLWGF